MLKRVNHADRGMYPLYLYFSKGDIPGANLKSRKMKASTIQKRLDSRYTGSKSAKEYQYVKDIATGKFHSTWKNKKGEIIIRTVYTTGSGKWTSIANHTFATKKLLELVGLKCEMRNDAPKGGQTGIHIAVLTKIEY